MSNMLLTITQYLKICARVLTNEQKCGMIVPKIEKGNPSVNSTLLPNTMIISLVLIGLLVIIEELMVVGRRSD